MGTIALLHAGRTLYIRSHLKAYTTEGSTGMVSQLRAREKEVEAQMQIVRFVVEDFIPSADPARGRNRLAQRVAEKFGDDAAAAFFVPDGVQLSRTLV